MQKYAYNKINNTFFVTSDSVDHRAYCADQSKLVIFYRKSSFVDYLIAHTKDLFEICDDSLTREQIEEIYINTAYKIATLDDTFYILDSISNTILFKSNDVREIFAFQESAY